MEFNEKLQELRKQRGLTQEELAASLFVSRAAVSKWESGRGYPSIDSLREIAKFFSVSIDELLSSNEALTVAEEDNRKRCARTYDLLFGLLDIGTAIFFFMPFLAERVGGAIQAVSLLSLSVPQLYLRIAYFVIVIGIISSGILTLALMNFQGALWVAIKYKISLILGVVGVLIFIISLQVYAAALLFIFLLIKLSVSVKKK